jgi:hypothetical protein
MYLTAVKALKKEAITLQCSRSLRFTDTMKSCLKCGFTLRPKITGIFVYFLTAVGILHMGKCTECISELFGASG